MLSVNVTELRQNLPTYLRAVRQGKKVRVTLRGRVIAELTPPAPAPEAGAAARNLLRGSVRRYDQPTEPAVAPGDWELSR